MTVKQRKGKNAYARARTTKGGKGPIKKRSSFKKAVKHL